MKLKRTLKKQMCRFGAILWLTLFGFTTVLRAEPVDVEKAKAVALTQLKRVTGAVSLRSASALDLVYEPKSETNQPYFYVFNGDKGFVIVSGDDRVAPILGYSDEGNFDPNNIPPNMVEFLKGYQREIDFVIGNDIKSESDLQKKWKGLGNNNEIQTRSYTPGNYLIESNWGQGDPYNKDCPTDGSSYIPCSAGCFAIAMSQIIRYWGLDRGIAPTHGFGSRNSINFETAFYDYNNMPVGMSNASSEVEKDAVAQLVYHCGIASNMRYCFSGDAASGSTTMEVAMALRNHFGYSDVSFIGEQTPSTLKDLSTLKSIIRSEIDKEQPVIYVGHSQDGSIHAFICDGYNSSDEFHVNWGYGSYKGWYLLTALVSQSTGHDYSYYTNGVAIIYNIYPVRDIHISNENRSVIYVTPEGAGNRDGSSWNNAMSDLYSAVQSNNGQPVQIWVKKGTYYGNTSAGYNSAAFIIGENNRVYGGFEGYENSLEERMLNNPSILDGQSLRRVLGQTSDFALSNTSLWDGFTVKNGLNNQKGASNIEISNGYPIVNGSDMTGNGGGVYLKKNGILKNCIIKNCTAISGGGVFNNGGTIIDCSFYNNQAERAGALYNSSEGIVQLSNSIIENNRATTGVAYAGGGIFNSGRLYLYEGVSIQNNNGVYGGGVYNNGNMLMLSGNISHNTGANGGGVYCDGPFTMSGGIISYNQAGSDGGGIVINQGKNGEGIYTFSGGSIINNTANNNGGGINSYSGLIYITDSIKIQGNSALFNGGGIYISKGYLNLISGFIGVNTQNAPQSVDEALALGGNCARNGNGGGIYVSGNIYGTTYIHSTDAKGMVIGGNFARNGGGLFSQELNERIELLDSVLICGNTATNSGGGVYYTRETLLNGCTISHNKASSNGGGIYSEGTFSNLKITGNTLITNNTASQGGGVYNTGSKYQAFSMSGGKIYGNTATNGSGIYNARGGNYSLLDSAKVSDVIYIYNNIDVMGNGSYNTYFTVSGLTYHTDNTKPITIQLWDPSSGSLATLAKYNTSEEATAAVNNGVYVVSNYGWRPVAMGVDVRVEPYTPPVIAGNVIHVTPEGAGSQDGSSWANAKSDLYTLMMTDRADTMQIWVKEGTYYGNTTVGQGGNLAAFTLGKRNKVYGGFAGNESSLSARAQNNPSILDGQSSRRVLCQLMDFTEPDSSFIDGFTIQNGLDTIIGSANIEIVTGGQSDHNGGTDMTGNGGGVYLKKNGILRNCVIEHCKARSGGGVFNYGGKVINCSFNYNEAEHASGLFNRGIASLGNCSISNNKTTHRLGYGGGIYNIATLYILDGVLINNNKGIVGNGVYTHSVATTTMDGGVISENTGGSYGGGIYNDGIVVMNGGNITNNQSGNGGGITSHGKLTVNAGSISYNTSTCGGGIMNGGDLWINSSSVKIQGNYTGIYGMGGAIYNGGNTYLNGGTIGIPTDNYPESQEEALASGGNVAQIGGGIYSDRGKLTIGNSDSIIIGGNYSTVYGGGIYTRTMLTLSSNVIINGNTCDGFGGGLYSAGAIILLEGCSISYNKAGDSGGGVYQYGNFFTYAGTKINNNEAGQDGGGIRVGGSFYTHGGEFSNNKATNRGGAIFNGHLASLDRGVFFNNKAYLGDGVYNSAYNFLLSSAVVMKDILYIPDPSCALCMNIPQAPNSVIIQGGTGYSVAYCPLLTQSQIDQGLVVSTPGLRPVKQGDYVYLYSDDTRSMDLGPTTDNELVDLKEISVYPALVTSGGMLTVESPDRGIVSVWSLSGTLVGQYKLDNGKTQISAPYISGNYVVKIITDAGDEKVVKIIVK